MWLVIKYHDGICFRIRFENASKRFGCGESDVKRVMKSKLGNTAKGFKVQMNNAPGIVPNFY